jgi:hypothetical protein
MFVFVFVLCVFAGLWTTTSPSFFGPIGQLDQIVYQRLVVMEMHSWTNPTIRFPFHPMFVVGAIARGWVLQSKTMTPVVHDEEDHVRKVPIFHVFRSTHTKKGIGPPRDCASHRRRPSSSSSVGGRGDVWHVHWQHLKVIV